MDLKDILTISGKPGLYKLIANNKNGLIVESLRDNKRVAVFATDKISSLDEISIFMENEDMPLKDVFVKLYKHLEHKPVEQNIINDNKKMKELFKAFLPEYDEDRVYASHQKKLFQWYNELLSLNLIDEIEETAVEEKVDETDKVDKIDKADKVDKTDKVDEAN
ncbi:DUF5606 domain-containing protein [Bacteroidales bacterium OttesenSCG-928-K03]|nr:DUF5606 domain-containing protein [Odoribacter sp. OttesenSCG-928-L07]MDL2238831.1 DUF5606 domain-containing protein [Bacteroidales bacterium OttesenSCG-928-L14]MDL2240236.1 DUF5606 domain-containing protein [Bacteroidales bacterium OttesenSCG-928-K22]MDL2242428.1 DUF5606 domain-containing protein [Bacteroidales bacterium OttesenSCG-928-K03]